MAGAQLYTLLRKVHLYTGLSLLTFVVMYFVTGYPIIHEDLMARPDPVHTERVEVLARPPSAPLAAYAEYLQEQLQLPGKRTEAHRLDDGRHRFEIFRPGFFHEVVVDAAGDTARIHSRQEGLRQTLVGFHRMHGYGGGWLYDLWVLFYDLASLSLIAFAASGIYLWWRLSRRKVWGAFCLAVSWGYAAITVAYLICAP